MRLYRRCGLEIQNHVEENEVQVECGISSFSSRPGVSIGVLLTWYLKRSPPTLHGASGMTYGSLQAICTHTSPSS